ncbi:MAG TPA: hemerythrin domain-containing protein [Gemmatimonadaceae bacterium]|nr:hemerythrin domain-containing protein [Gemmatimonadaceae bacterium]
MRITDAFRGEHGVFYAQFDVIERIVPTAESAAEVRGLAEMLAAALVPHAKLEDELLFNPLEEYAGPDADPIEVMRFEHDDIESSLMRATTSRDLSEARELLLQAVDRAREHFGKEELVVFPLADREIDREKLDQLGEQWASRRAVAVPSISGA